MKFSLSLFSAVLTFGCSTPVSPVVKPAQNGVATESKTKAKGQADSTEQPAAQPEPKEEANTSAEKEPAASDPNIMSLAEAKEKCAACHQPGGGTGANAWNSANGTEEDWKSFAVAARAAVESNRMPPPSGLTEPDKARMLAYLDKLSGQNPMNPTMPTSVSYNFDTAKALCIGCHDQNQRKPRLDTPRRWRDNKSDIRAAVRDGSMPKNKNLSEAERAALLKFIKSF